MSFTNQFSSRTNWDMGANRLNDELERLRAQGQAVVDLTESNPTRCGFSYPKHIFEALNHPKNLEYHPDSKGMLSARQAIAGYYADQGKKVDPRSIVLTSSTSEAYTFLFRLLLNPGEKVLIARPGYPLFQYLIELADATYDFYPLVYEWGRWRIDLHALEQAIDPSTKAIILVNPNNPTGSYMIQNDLDELNRICLRHHLSLISDEVFFDYQISPCHGISMVGNTIVPTYVLNGVSKTLGLPQMKLSWIAASAPGPCLNEAMSRLEIIADTFLSVNTPVSNALPVWLSSRHQLQLMILDRVKQNHELVKDFVALHHGEFFLSQGGWYAVFRLPSVRDEEGWVLKLLSQKHVLVHPGYFFDLQGDGFFVVSLLPEVHDMTEGLKRISQFLKGKA